MSKISTSIQIIVDCSGPDEALSIMQTLSKAGWVLADAELTAPPRRKAPARKTKRKGAKKKTRRAAPPPEPEEPEVSIEDLQLALQAKMSRDGPDSIRELFAEFGVAKLSQLDPANYAEMLDNLQEE